MSYLERIQEANTHDLAGFRRFEWRDGTIGWVRHTVAEVLNDFGDTFRVESDRICLTHRLAGADVPAVERTAAMASVASTLRDAGMITGWRGEAFPVRARIGDEPAFLLERAALPIFGIRGHGVHVNGFVRKSDERRPAGTAAPPAMMWVGRRAADKPTWPGLLDQIVAGGQPAGLGLAENVVKECGEEAGIAPALARTARPAGIIRYVLETPEGLRPDIVHVYDLELPPSFEPVNTDGEVAGFELWPLDRVAQVVRDTTDFKFNCALVVIDFLLRHGHIEADDPDYAAICAGLLRQHPGRPGSAGAG